jgi:hypothetical protein
MRASGKLSIFAILIAVPLSQADALCSYDGVYNLKTTVRQEFRDSPWVVRARVVSVIDGDDRDNGPWIVYRLKIERIYKGRPPRPLSMFTEVNSGGFYLNSGWGDHHVGNVHLLFLGPPGYALPRPARGSTMINYSCGQSKEWNRVGPKTRLLLERLSRGRRARQTA